MEAGQYGVCGVLALRILAPEPKEYKNGQGHAPTLNLNIVGLYVKANIPRYRNALIITAVQV